MLCYYAIGIKQAWSYIGQLMKSLLFKDLFRRDLVFCIYIAPYCLCGLVRPYMQFNLYLIWRSRSKVRVEIMQMWSYLYGLAWPLHVVEIIPELQPFKVKCFRYGNVRIMKMWPYLITCCKNHGCCGIYFSKSYFTFLLHSFSIFCNKANKLEYIRPFWCINQYV